LTAANPDFGRTLRGRVVVGGIGETQYFKWGRAPYAEAKLALMAITSACEDAGIRPNQIDGFASYASERNTPMQLATALNCDEVRFANLVWGGGGGGGSGAVANAAMAVATGSADCVAVYRGLAQGQFGRFGMGGSAGEVSGEYALTYPYGLVSPAQTFAMRYQRWMQEHHGVGMLAQKAVAMASYFHAQNNPHAVMHGRPLTSEKYDESRWIVEPWRLFDCCQENDGAAALLIMTPELAQSVGRENAPYLLGAAQGSSRRSAAWAHNGPDYASSNFADVGRRLWEMTGLKPADVDVIQSYENFTGGVVMSMVEHGFCEADAVDEVLTLNNLTVPSGRLPLNTSGGNLAHCYMHGLELVIEAVRQLRGESPNQVADAKVAFVSSGPMVAPVSNLVLGSAEALG
jgi:acetyl-CoA acetyltransferase